MMNRFRFQTVRFNLNLRPCKKVVASIERGKLPEMSVADVQRNFRAAMNSGLKKITGKIGISLLSSYHGGVAAAPCTARVHRPG